MKGHGTQFGRKKEAAIAALLTARNIEEAAKSFGVAPNTLLNWMKVPEFQAEYREARRAASSALARNCHTLLSESCQSPPIGSNGLAGFSTAGTVRTVPTLLVPEGSALASLVTLNAMP